VPPSASTENAVLGVVVDGRSDHDTGLTLAEMAALPVERGAHCALTLDGGASTAPIAGGRLRNTPKADDGSAPTFDVRPRPRGLEAGRCGGVARESSVAAL
jgi:exopolysaccharide biosynthesis protein